MKTIHQYTTDEFLIGDIYPVGLARKLAREKRRATIVRKKTKRKQRDEEDG